MPERGDAELVAEAVPYVSAAVSAYGGAVLAKARDDVGDASVEVGRRILQRVFGQRRDGEPLPDFLAWLVADPGDADVVAQLRLVIRRALADDPVMRDEVNRTLGSAPAAPVNQRAHAGRDGYTAGRDMTIHQRND
jgi:hypothetical protein